MKSTKDERRKIAKISSGERRVVSAARHPLNVENANEIVSGRMEMDSHADTCVFGKNFVVLQCSERVCDVAPYTDTYDSISNVPIGTGATAWDNPMTGETMILVINEGLFMSDHMEHSLINPNQLRAFGTTIQDNPFDVRPMELVDPDEDVRIPLSLRGSIVVLKTRTPTQSELEMCRHLVLSSPNEWNPDNMQVPEIMAVERQEHRDAPKSSARYFISAVRGEVAVDLDEYEDVFDLDAINCKCSSCRCSKEKGEKCARKRSRTFGSTDTKNVCFR